MIPCVLPGDLTEARLFLRFKVALLLRKAYKILSIK